MKEFSVAKAKEGHRRWSWESSELGVLSVMKKCWSFGLVVGRSQWHLVVSYSIQIGSEISHLKVDSKFPYTFSNVRTLLLVFSRGSANLLSFLILPFFHLLSFNLKNLRICLMAIPKLFYEFFNSPNPQFTHTAILQWFYII